MEIKEDIKITLVENGLQEKFDFTELLVNDLAALFTSYAEKREKEKEIGLVEGMLTGLRSTQGALSRIGHERENKGEGEILSSLNNARLKISDGIGMYEARLWQLKKSLKEETV